MIGTYDASPIPAPASPGTMSTRPSLTSTLRRHRNRRERLPDGATPATVTTINGYVNGATGDQINFSVGDWASWHAWQWCSSTYGLLAASGAPSGRVRPRCSSSPHLAPLSQLPKLCWTVSRHYANAAQLQSQLAIGTVGDIELAPAASILGAHDIFHVLMAYSTGAQIDIADVSIMNTTGAAISGIDTANAGLSISVHNLVDITGISNLGLLNPHDITFTCLSKIRAPGDPPGAPLKLRAAGGFGPPSPFVTELDCARGSRQVARNMLSLYSF